ncbi:unnamed protein product [Caenorhabditis bovis]|uniref:C-type lectin domain-containing protein n=1 Tax=Caenorhabditis bovis TaxID=2654633 RepID=A0A8S1EIY1_9PELO|nr:unnamed protein product [Caenorhabditis bovis]
MKNASSTAAKSAAPETTVSSSGSSEPAPAEASEPSNETSTNETSTEKATTNEATTNESTTNETTTNENTTDEKVGDVGEKPTKPKVEKEEEEDHRDPYVLENVIREDPATGLKDVTMEDLPFGGIIGVTMVMGVAPVKKKRTYFVVLSKRALEVYDSEKSFRKGSCAKHIVDLATAFNVHMNHYDSKLKRCLCVMGPDDTVVMRPENDLMLKNWYDAILNCLLLSRQLRIGRPCAAYEIFEACYDVEVVAHMKNAKAYKKTRMEDGYVNICESMNLCGIRRLCFYSHTVVLADREIEPVKTGCPDSGFPPFRAEAFVEFPRPLIAYFGVQEKYFYLRLGKGIAIGGTELLVLCDSFETAQAIHATMRTIIEREAGKRIILERPPEAVKAIEAGKEREGPREDCCDKGHQDGPHSETPQPNMESLSVPSPHAHHRNKLSLDSTPLLTAKERRKLLRDCLSFANSLEFDESAPSSPFGTQPRGSLGSFHVDHLSRLDQPRGSVHSVGAVPVGGVLPDRSRRASHQFRLTDHPLMKDPLRYKKNSTASVNEAGSSSRKHVVPMFEPPKAEKEKKKKPEKGSKKKKKKEEEEEAPPPVSRRRRSNSPPFETYLATTLGMNFSDDYLREGALRKMSSIRNDDTYSPMEPSDWNLTPNPLLLQYSSDRRSGNRAAVAEKYRMHFPTQRDREALQLRFQPSPRNLALAAANAAPRANSFGGKTETVEKPKKSLFSSVLWRDKKEKKEEKKQAQDEQKKESSSENLPSSSTGNTSSLTVEDPRKRAFSLGSKSFFNFNFNQIGLNDFRRLVKKPLPFVGRSSSPNNNSASGVSNSSSASPSSSGNIHLTSNDNSRNRTGSFESGRGSPSKKCNKNDDDHHVEIDFGNPSDGKSACPSLTKTEISKPLKQQSQPPATESSGRHRSDYPRPKKPQTKEEELYYGNRPSDKLLRDLKIAKRGIDYGPCELMTGQPAKKYPENKSGTESRWRQATRHFTSSFRRDDDKYYNRKKISVCGSIVEEKEDGDSSAELDDDSKTIVADFATDNLEDSYGFYWAGAYRENNTAQWHWIDGSPLNYTNWVPGDNQIDKYCLKIRFSDGRWLSEYCDNTEQFVCAKNAGGPSPPYGTCPPCMKEL